MGAKESVEAAVKMNADGWGHVEVCIQNNNNNNKHINIFISPSVANDKLFI